MTTTTPAPTAPANALTGKRRVAFASFVDENYLPGFLTLLRSLALSNPPGICEDFVVLHDGLRPASVERIRPCTRAPTSAAWTRTTTTRTPRATRTTTWCARPTSSSTCSGCATTTP